MTPRSALFALAVIVAAAPTAASAHAFLEHAVPSVGSTGNQAPAELQLSFTEDIVVALSGVTLASSGGAVPTAKPTGSGHTLRLRLGRALPPGTYTVKWHVVATDTHPTSGSYKFTVAP